MAESEAINTAAKTMAETPLSEQQVAQESAAPSSQSTAPAGTSLVKRAAAFVVSEAALLLLLAGASVAAFYGYNPKEAKEIMLQNVLWVYLPVRVFWVIASLVLKGISKVPRIADLFVLGGAVSSYASFYINKFSIGNSLPQLASQYLGREVGAILKSVTAEGKEDWALALYILLVLAVIAVAGSVLGFAAELLLAFSRLLCGRGGKKGAPAVQQKQQQQQQEESSALKKEQ